MERDDAGERRLSQFGETWVRQMEHEAGPPSALVGWCLWAAIAGFTVLFALVGFLQARA